MTRPPADSDESPAAPGRPPAAAPGQAYGERYTAALAYAAELHASQLRKGTSIPYVSHLLSVSAYVWEAGGDEDQAIAGLLHDAVEDQGGAPVLATIRRRFGERVARIVDLCSDTDEMPKPPWRARKEAHIARIAGGPDDALIVVAADKLHNARSVVIDVRRHGPSVWSRFKGGRDGTIWYHQEMLTVLAARIPDCALLPQLADAVNALEGLPAWQNP